MADPKAGKSDDDRVVIKKYANRRLYNTASSSYVTLDHLSEMVKQGVHFVVYDAKTQEDITRSVLTQIIFEEEGRSQSLLPIEFLRQLIGFYGNSMQAFLPSFLELSLSSFSEQQERMRSQMTGLGQTKPGLGAVEDQIQQNLVLFNRAMKMFSPFAYAKPDEPAAPAKPAAASDPSLDDLKQRMEEMAAQIERLASKSGASGG